MMLEEFVQEIGRCGREEYFERFGEIEQVLASLVYDITQEQIQSLAQAASDAPVWMKIHILSFCMKVSGDPRYAMLLLETVQQADYDDVGEYNRLSHYWQVNTAVFKDSRLKTPKVQELLAKLYNTLFMAFLDSFGIKKRCYIPIKSRNCQLVFVFTSQVLHMEHAPTKTLLDRCYVLQKQLGKKVFIVNTAMQITKKGQAPFFDLQEADYLHELSTHQYLEFRGEKFDFLQCGDDMPDLDTIAGLVRMIQRKKPYYLLDIGGSDICADICGMFVPQLTISTVFSGIAVSCGEYQLIGGAVEERDKTALRILGVEEGKVKHTLFTFSFKEQTHYYTREELGMREGAFLLLVVGWRLASEIDDAFLELLQAAVRSADIQVIFMGKFENYVERMREYPALRKGALYVGMQEDALAVTACCDLYVNPARQGGGSSAAEALYQGLPVVTLPSGDVSVAAGAEFCVPDYAAMKGRIARYVNDVEYYRNMSGLAKKRAALLLDSNTVFGSAIHEFEEMITQTEAGL